MRNRREAYSAYLDTTIEEYCSSSVEPFWVELDHAGVQALIDCLVNPAGLRVEISYLDRSSGAEVNVHAFDSEALISTSERPRSTMSLLYRP